MRRSGPERPSGTGGFTLVEILVALVVLAMLLAVATTALRLLSTSAARGERSMSRLDMISRGLGAVRRDLTRIERAIRVEPTESRFVFTGDARGLSFVIVEPAYPTEPGSYRVTYSVRRAGGQTELVRSRDIYDPKQKTPPKQREESADVVVIEGPYDIAFSYLEKSAAREKWIDRWTDPHRMPELIRLEVTSRSPGVTSPPPLIARLRIDAEIACVADAKRACTPRTGGAIEEAKGRQTEAERRGQR